MLRLKTEFSFGRAIGTVRECLDEWQESHDYVYVPITDNASVWGWALFAAECRARRLEPVYGAEVDVAPTRWGYEAQRKNQRQQWLIFSRHRTATPVNRLIEQVLNRPKPKILTYAEALAEPYSTVVIGGNTTDFEALEKAINGRADNVEVYAMLTPSCSHEYVRNARALALNFAACGDNQMPAEEHRHLFNAMLPNVAEENDPQPIQAFGDLLFTLTDKFGDTINVSKAFDVSRKILYHAAAADRVIPTLPRHPKVNRLRSICYDMAEKGRIDLSDPEYGERLNYELDVICQKRLQSYFLMVHDLCGQADGRWLIGPGRGSSAASLVCYVLGITHVDPVRHGLMFQRFLNPERNDMPDIDIDIQHDKREAAFEWLVEKYEHVARLGAVTTWGRASSFAQAAKAANLNMVLSHLFETPQEAWEAERVPFREFLLNNPRARAIVSNHPKLMLAAQMAGRARHTTTHAAAFAINEDPLEKIAPAEAQTLQLTKTDTNLLKLDVLGVRALSVIAETLESVGKGIRWIHTLEPTAPEAFKILNDQRFAGIYQYQSSTNRSLARQVEAENFEDLIALGSLARPGPLESGQADLWVNRRRTPDLIASDGRGQGPIAKITMPTLGVIMFQEQVMSICREVGRMSWADVHDIRRLISGTGGKEELAKYKDKFIAGAMMEDMSRSNAVKLWDILQAHGGYSFNRAHACAYAMVTYWCLALKAWWPLEYACAYLNHQQAKKQRQEMIDEVRKHHRVRVVPFDAQRSGLKWQVVKSWGGGSAYAGWRGEVLLGPLTNVVDIGEKTAAAIVGARARGERLDEKLRKKLQKAQKKAGEQT